MLQGCDKSDLVQYSVGEATSMTLEHFWRGLVKKNVLRIFMCVCLIKRIQVVVRFSVSILNCIAFAQGHGASFEEESVETVELKRLAKLEG